jgi:hypothetical protein
MAYLAPPPQDPMPIDAGVIYNYVIAQQGYGAISVDALNNFSFAVTQGEPGLLLFRFDGTPGASPTYHTITIHIGPQTQTLHVTVLATNPFQRVANITNPPSVNAPAGSSISVLLTTTNGAGLGTTDVGPAGPLPTGLSFDSINNRITGAIADPGFYPVILEAKKSAFPQVYRRYLVFTVSAASTSPTNPVSVGGPSSGRLLFDGDFTEAQIAGIAEYEVPFPEDPRPYLYRIPYWQLIDHYEEPELGSAGPLGGSCRRRAGEFQSNRRRRGRIQTRVRHGPRIAQRIRELHLSVAIGSVESRRGHVLGIHQRSPNHHDESRSIRLLRGRRCRDRRRQAIRRRKFRRLDARDSYPRSNRQHGSAKSATRHGRFRRLSDLALFHARLQRHYTVGGVGTARSFSRGRQMRRWKGSIYERKCRFLIAEGSPRQH